MNRESQLGFAGFGIGAPKLIAGMMPYRLLVGYHCASVYGTTPCVLDPSPPLSRPSSPGKAVWESVRRFRLMSKELAHGLCSDEWRQPKLNSFTMLSPMTRV